MSCSFSSFICFDNNSLKSFVQYDHTFVRILLNYSHSIINLSSVPIFDHREDSYSERLRVIIEKIVIVRD